MTRFFVLQFNGSKTGKPLFAKMKENSTDLSHFGTENLMEAVKYRSAMTAQERLESQFPRNANMWSVVEVKQVLSWVVA